MALVTISDVSNVAASQSTLTRWELSVRETKALAEPTSSGRPGMVSEPRTVARVPPAAPRDPAPRCPAPRSDCPGWRPDHDRRELPSGVSMLSASKIAEIVSAVRDPAEKFLSFQTSHW
jgi:hypothetical protein